MISGLLQRSGRNLLDCEAGRSKPRGIVFSFLGALRSTQYLLN